MEMRRTLAGQVLIKTHLPLDKLAAIKHDNSILYDTTDVFVSQMGYNVKYDSS